MIELKGTLTGFSATPVEEPLRTWDIALQFEGYPRVLYDAFVSRDPVLVGGSSATVIQIDHVFIPPTTNVRFRGSGNPPELHNGMLITVQVK